MELVTDDKVAGCGSHILAVFRLSPPGETMQHRVRGWELWAGRWTSVQIGLNMIPLSSHVEVSIVPGPMPPLDLHVPDRWECARLGPARFHLLAPEEAIDGQNLVSVAIGGERGGLCDPWAC
jgi:hypothetical protein